MSKLAIVAVGVLTLANCALGVDSAGADDGQAINETRSVNADAHIDVSNVKGSVSVTVWDKPEVDITGTLGKGSKGLRIDGGGERLRIKVEAESSGWFGGNSMGDTRLVLKLPRQASLQVEVVSAGVDVDGLAGKSLKVEGVSGKLKLTGGASEIRISSVSGDVTLDAPGKETHIETVSGDVQAHGMIGEFKVETVSGRIHVDAGSLRRLDAGTVSGDIEIRSVPDKSARYEVGSMSGDVLLFLPVSLSARIEAETFSGTLKSMFGTVKRKEFEHGTSLETTVGAGDGRISVQSFSGDVELRSQ
jgi:DUF4097 and DUF4098 domain-containing protein YvlB